VFEGVIIKNDPFNAEVRTEVTGIDGVQTVLYENITDIANRMTRTTSNLTNFSNRHAEIDLNRLISRDGICHQMQIINKRLQRVRKN
jgi:hypothetical protein